MILMQLSAEMLAARRPGAACSGCGRRVRPAADELWAEVSGRFYCPACVVAKRHIPRCERLPSGEE